MAAPHDKAYHKNTVLLSRPNLSRPRPRVQDQDHSFQDQDQDQDQKVQDQDQDQDQDLASLIPTKLTQWLKDRDTNTIIPNLYPVT